VLTRQIAFEPLPASVLFARARPAAWLRPAGQSATEFGFCRGARGAAGPVRSRLWSPGLPDGESGLVKGDSQTAFGVSQTAFGDSRTAFGSHFFRFGRAFGASGTAGGGVVLTEKPMVLRFSLPLLGRMSFFRLDRRRRAGKSRVVLPGVGRGGEWNPLNPEPARLAVAFYDSPGLLYDRGVAYDLPGGPPFTHMAKPKLNLDRLNPDEVVSLASTIKTALTGNATFTTPNPTLVALGTLRLAPCNFQPSTRTERWLLIQRNQRRARRSCRRSCRGSL
jgi:hypothetical protein